MNAKSTMHPGRRAHVPRWLMILAGAVFTVSIIAGPAGANTVRIYGSYGDWVQSDHGGATYDNVMATWANYTSGSYCVGNAKSNPAGLWTVDCTGGSPSFASQSAGSLAFRFCYGTYWLGNWSWVSCSDPALIAYDY
ncbi:MAG: hypothetical protein M5U14_19060 [Acidimicrobiia bacterium]|nr:hypothetical protein [Acidimicrobiia bacterium]